MLNERLGGMLDRIDHVFNVGPKYDTASLKISGSDGHHGKDSRIVVSVLIEQHDDGGATHSIRLRKMLFAPI